MAVNNQEIELNEIGTKEGLTVVAFHTNDELYTREAKRMKASAEKLNIPVSITVLESRGDWLKNTSMKAAFLQSIRNTVKGDILYVDVDAVFHEDPRGYLSQLDCDIAVHYDCKNKHLMSGTLFLRDTQNVQRVLQSWVSYCDQNPEVWDQKALETILEEDKACKVFPLPVVFCWVFDRVYNFSLQGDLPIFIEHLQASRTAKDDASFFRRLFKRNKGRLRREKRVREIEAKLFLD